MKIAFISRGHFFQTIILSTNNPMLSSKLNVLFHNSIPSCQMWKIHSWAGVIFSRQLFWVSTILCYLQNWTLGPKTLFSVARCENSFTNRDCFYETIILSTKNPMLSSKMNVLSHNSLPSCQIWKNPFTSRGCWFAEIVLSINNPMLSSKLNISCHISVYLNTICSIST